MKEAQTKDEPASAVGQMPFIDVCGTFFDYEAWTGFLTTLAAAAPQYFWKFRDRFLRLSGADPDAYAAAMKHSPQEGVKVLLAASGLDRRMSDHAASLRRQGAVRQVLHGTSIPLPGGGCHSERLAREAAQYGDLFEVWAGMSLKDAERSAARLERLAGEYGVRGCNVTGFLEGMAPDHPSCSPLFETAQRLDLPVWVHAGQNFATTQPMDLCGWQSIDRLACRYPRLKILIGHGGWPWVTEMLALCQRHRNVYLEFSSYRPRLMRQAGSGWDALFNQGAAGGRGRVLFGSTTWVHDVTERGLVDELCDTGLDPAVIRDWVLNNPARLLGINT